MRIIATTTLKEFWTKHPKSEQALKSWLQEVELGDWNSPQQLKSQYRSASILSGKRVVFNINGNSFRLIVDIEFRLQIIFVVWFGTHKEYDKIDSKTISYVKANKN
jgi:mRNA interferase HigB